MTSITFYLILIPTFAFALLAVNFIFAPHTPYLEKNSVFECGYHSFLGQNRTQFSISFFIFALLFLLFDLEILLMYPFGVSASVNSIYGLVIMLIFFAALTLGFTFELGKNALNIDSRQFKESKALASTFFYTSIIKTLYDNFINKQAYFIFCRNSFSINTFRAVLRMCAFALIISPYIKCCLEIFPTSPVLTTIIFSTPLISMYLYDKYIKHCALDNNQKVVKLAKMYIGIWCRFICLLIVIPVKLRYGGDILTILIAALWLETLNISGMLNMNNYMQPGGLQPSSSTQPSGNQPQPPQGPNNTPPVAPHTNQTYRPTRSNHPNESAPTSEENVLPYYDSIESGNQLTTVINELESTVARHPDIKCPTLSHTNLDTPAKNRIKASIHERCALFNAAATAAATADQAQPKPIKVPEGCRPNDRFASLNAARIGPILKILKKNSL